MRDARAVSVTLLGVGLVLLGLRGLGLAERPLGPQAPWELAWIMLAFGTIVWPRQWLWWSQAASFLGVTFLLLPGPQSLDLVAVGVYGVGGLLALEGTHLGVRLAAWAASGAQAGEVPLTGLAASSVVGILVAVSVGLGVWLAVRFALDFQASKVLAESLESNAGLVVALPAAATAILIWLGSTPWLERVPRVALAAPKESQDAAKTELGAAEQAAISSSPPTS